jgi:hypothetical protein
MGIQTSDSIKRIHRTMAIENENVLPMKYME